jgi:hypothetical protein
MRRRLVVVMAVLALATLVGSSRAEASVSWPANCTNFKCVNAHLNALHTQNVALKAGLAKLSWVNPCLDSLVPITAYPSYLYDDGFGGSFDTTALDYTIAGEVPDYWVSVVNPSCAPATARLSLGAHVFHVAAPPAHVGHK